MISESADYAAIKVGVSLESDSHDAPAVACAINSAFVLPRLLVLRFSEVLSSARLASICFLVPQVKRERAVHRSSVNAG